MNPEISIVMGSDSDLAVMEQAANLLNEFDQVYEMTIVSAHRTPTRMMEYANAAAGKGIKVIIAGAGGAAHLPGMIASSTILPVIGVPIKSSNSLDGWDSILSILQMPSGVPVATVALNGAENAAILALQILALNNVELSNKLQAYKLKMQESVEHKADQMSRRL